MVNVKQDYTIYILDDELSVCKALKQVISRVYENVHFFVSAQACLEGLSKYECHLLICDVNMPEMDGLEMLRKVKKIRPKMPVLLVTGYGDIPTAVKAVKSGAYDFIEKPLDQQSILGSIKESLSIYEVAEPDVAYSLSIMEIKILRKILQGQSSKEIAYELNRSTRTIENHRQRIMKKLNVSNTAELVKTAMDMSIL